MHLSQGIVVECAKYTFSHNARKTLQKSTTVPVVPLEQCSCQLVESSVIIYSPEHVENVVVREKLHRASILVVSTETVFYNPLP